MNELNLDNYASKIVEDIQQSITGEVLTIAQNALINALNRTVYQQQKSYRQTRDLISAVEVTNLKVGANSATFSVIINASKLGIEIRYPSLNAHASVGTAEKSTDFSQHLIGVLDQGTEGYGKSSPIYNHPAHGFFDLAYDEMDEKIIMEMARALKGKGYKVTVY